ATPVHIAPSEESPTLTILGKGAPVTVSNSPTSGFYKGRIGTGDIGWIAADRIVIYDVSGEEPIEIGSGSEVFDRSQAGIGPRYIRVRGFGGYSFWSLSEFEGALEIEGLSGAIGYGAEIQLNMGRSSALLF